MTEDPSVNQGPNVGFVEIDTRVAQSARVYDYLQGGVENFVVDRTVVEHASAQAGGVEKIRKHVRAKRKFLGRAVRYLAGDVGVRQFLDIGTGIPSTENVLTVAQTTAPDCRVVSVDKDPVVLAHAHTLRMSAPEGAAAYIDGDLRDSDGILAQASAILDFSKPIGVVFIGVLHHFTDDEDPWAVVRRYVEAVPSGSYLVIEHLGSEDVTNIDFKSLPAAADFVLVPRGLAKVARFFEGLDLVEPGVVLIDHWRPDGELPEYESPNPAGVGRKP